MHSIGRKREVMTAQEAFVLDSMKDGGICSAEAQKAATRLVDTGLALKKAWPFAYDEALAILESLDQPGVIVDRIGKFIEGNCTYKAYVPYAKLVQLSKDESIELTDESFTLFCDLLSEIAEAAVEYYKKKFSF